MGRRKKKDGLGPVYSPSDGVETERPSEDPQEQEVLPGLEAEAETWPAGDAGEAEQARAWYEDAEAALVEVTIGRVAREVMQETNYLSYSSMTAYSECSYRWFLSRVRGIARPAGWPLLWGSALHNTVERYLKQNALTRALAMTADPPEVLPLAELWRREWWREVKEREKGGTVDWGEETPEGLYAKGKALVQLSGFEVQYVDARDLEHVSKVDRVYASFQDWLDRMDLLFIRSYNDFSPPEGEEIGVPAVELWMPRMRVTAVRPQITGRIDWIDGKGIPVDLKCTKNRTSEYAIRRQVQPMVYLMGLEEGGYQSPGNQFKHVYITRTDYPYTKRRRPRGQVVLTQWDEARLQWMRDWMRMVWRDMASGRITPNPTYEWCTPKFCHYWDLCRGQGDMPNEHWSYANQDTVYDLFARNAVDEQARKPDPDPDDHTGDEGDDDAGE